MLKIRRGKGEVRLGVQVRRRQVARVQTTPARRVVDPRDAEARAGDEGREVGKGTAEAGEDEGVGGQAKGGRGPGREVGAVAVADEGDLGGAEGAAGVRGEGGEHGGFDLELGVCDGGDPGGGGHAYAVVVEHRVAGC